MRLPCERYLLCQLLRCLSKTQVYRTLEVLGYAYKPATVKQKAGKKGAEAEPDSTDASKPPEGLPPAVIACVDRLYDIAVRAQASSAAMDAVVSNARVATAIMDKDLMGRLEQIIRTAELREALERLWTAEPSVQAVRNTLLDAFGFCLTEDMVAAYVHYIWDTRSMSSYERQLLWHVHVDGLTHARMEQLGIPTLLMYAGKQRSMPSLDLEDAVRHICELSYYKICEIARRDTASGGARNLAPWLNAFLETRKVIGPQKLLEKMHAAASQLKPQSKPVEHTDIQHTVSVSGLSHGTADLSELTELRGMRDDALPN